MSRKKFIKYWEMHLVYKSVNPIFLFSQINAQYIFEEKFNKYRLSQNSLKLRDDNFRSLVYFLNDWKVWYIYRQFRFLDTKYHILETKDNELFKRRKYYFVFTDRLIPRGWKIRHLFLIFFLTPFTWTLSNAWSDLQWSKTSRLEFIVLDGANQPNLEIFLSKNELEQTYLTYECEWKLSKP